jgi:mono/diheme cytochrome c family protein
MFPLRPPFYSGHAMRTARLAWTVLAALIGAAGFLRADEKSGPRELPAAADRPIDFVKDVQPLFAARCYECHGPKKQESAFRLDHKPTAMKGGDLGQAIIAGKGAESSLVRYVAGLEDGLQMPPEGEPLTKEQIGILRAWIDQGARWPENASIDLTKNREHWAFKTPVRPPLVSVAEPSWIRTPMDHFILARLEKEKLSPSPEADKSTLLRRLSLDLIGLPPTFEEVDAFLADTSDKAYERQVERLLASPHYGERWARHWLDAARYADSDGYEKDKSRQVWFYRDWVVSAFNRDLPYDQFVVEQLAGDLLPQAAQDQLVATGFLRNSMINEEGGVDPEQFRMDAMFDRMDAVGKSMLGITIQCAQCHNHKYDPITQEDYYRMFAYLNDTHEANIAVYTPDEQMQQAEIFRKIREIEENLQHTTPDWPAKMAAWEESVRNNQPDWQVLKVQNAGDNSQRYIYHDDGSQTAWGYAPTKWTSKFSGRSELTTIRAIRLEMLCDPNLPLGGPGRSPTGLFALSELTVEAVDAEKPASKAEVKLASATADFGNEEKPLEEMYHDKTDKKRITGPVAFAIDGKDETAWGIDAGPGRRNVERKAVFVLEKPIEFPKGAVLTFHVKQMHGGWNSDDNQNNNLGRFRFSVTGAAGATADPLPKRVRDIIAIPASDRTSAQLAALFSYWRTTVPEWKEASDQIEALWKEHPVGSSQLTMLPREDARMTSILKRGDFLKPVKPVQPGVPEVLHDLPADAPANRLTFAQWLVDEQSPTVARAFVNRVWQHYFGTGLVASSEDLGTQSEPPSHPELLDWLAVEFMERGWSIKNLHRLIVVSATYRQWSNVSPELLARDPYNRLLARGPRSRVEGEIVRDIALAASGLLNPKLGGPSVFPPSPEFLYQPPASYGPKVWKEEKGPDRYRRGLYTFRYRSVPYPMLQAFDAPNGDASCVRRVRSNTPLQALTTLNEPLFLECARALAMKTLTDGGQSDAERLTYAFRRCVSRPPSEAESKLLLELLSKETAKFSAPDAVPWDLAAIDPASPPLLPDGITPPQAAAWTAVARVLLNLDETITKE